MTSAWGRMAFCKIEYSLFTAFVIMGFTQDTAGGIGVGWDGMRWNKMLSFVLWP